MIRTLDAATIAATLAAMLAGCGDSPAATQEAPIGGSLNKVVPGKVQPKIEASKVQPIAQPPVGVVKPVDLQPSKIGPASVNCGASCGGSCGEPDSDLQAKPSTATALSPATTPTTTIKAPKLPAASGPAPAQPAPILPPKPIE